MINYIRSEFYRILHTKEIYLFNLLLMAGVLALNGGIPCRGRHTSEYPVCEGSVCTLVPHRKHGFPLCGGSGHGGASVFGRTEERRDEERGGVRDVQEPACFLKMHRIFCYGVF